jgi:hypothetical protein
MSVGESPRLFDRALRRRRAARWQDRFAGHDVFHVHAAALVADKLLDVTRDFPRASIWGDRGRHLLPRLPLGKIGEAVYADPFAIPGEPAEPPRPGTQGQQVRSFAAPGSRASGAFGGLARDDMKVVGDAELSPFADEAFDLVVSLLDLHAANDPVGVLIQAWRSLKPDGLFIGVMFGGGTLTELRTALGEAEVETAGGLSPRIFPFADVRDAGSLLQRAHFALPVADEDMLTIRYGDPMTLLGDLRGAGESNVLAERRRVPMRRGTLLSAMQTYAERFADQGRFRATFSFLTLTGWRPHPSQPQPLQPGSAQTSLADALKTVRD